MCLTASQYALNTFNGLSIFYRYKPNSSLVNGAGDSHGRPWSDCSSSRHHCALSIGGDQENSSCSREEASSQKSPKAGRWLLLILRISAHLKNNFHLGCMILVIVILSVWDSFTTEVLLVLSSWVISPCFEQWVFSVRHKQQRTSFPLSGKSSRNHSSLWSTEGNNRVSIQEDRAETGGMFILCSSGTLEGQALGSANPALSTRHTRCLYISTCPKH